MLKKKILIIATFISLIAFAFENWIYRNIYHGGFSLVEVIWLLLVVIVIVGIAVLVFGQNRIFYTAIKFCLVVGFILASIRYYMLAQGVQSHVKSPTYQVILIVIMTLLFGWMIAYKLNEDRWSKTARALIVGALIFVFSPNLMSAFNEKNNPAVLSSELNKLQTKEKQNIFYLVLDEWSIQKNDPIINAIQKSKRLYQIEKKEPAAYITTDALPSILLGRKITGLAPCGTTRLCSNNESLNFKNLKSETSNIDMVGYWHPYCDIQGLRYCYREDNVFYLDPAFDIYCKGVKRISETLYQNNHCTAFKESGARDKHVQTMIEKIWSAPFWSEGGVLFTHIPTPHPNMETGEQGLVVEYINELERLSIFISEVIERLEKKFEGQFTMVITSDHQLRKEIWCDFYPSHLNRKCNQEQLMSDKTIPYITLY